MKVFFKNYSLSIVLGFLFLVSWIGQGFFEATTVAAEAQSHGEAFRWSDFFWQFGQSTLENWQSEFLQLFSFVVLATFFIHKGSPQSKDGDDEMKASLDRIEGMLKDSRNQQP